MHVFSYYADAILPFLVVMYKMCNVFVLFIDSNTPRFELFTVRMLQSINCLLFDPLVLSLCSFKQYTKCRLVWITYHTSWPPPM